jgi:hypothetical protein
VLFPEGQHALPGKLGACRIVYGVALFVHEAMIGLVPKEISLDASVL